MDALSIPRIDALAAAQGPGLISFAGGTPHLHDLPVEMIVECFDEGIDEHDLAYGDFSGQAPLRAALAPLLAADGIEVDPERMVITSGAMQGLDLAFRTLVEPGELIVIESPTYPDALGALRLSHARIEHVPVDEDGLRVEALEGLVAEHGAPAAIYTMPTFQNPTGVSQTLERRRQLLAMAADLGTTVIEDDAYSAFRYDGEPLPPLAALSDDVVAVRSLSKMIAPGLRTGCVTGPADACRAIADAQAVTAICPSRISQLLAQRFVENGTLQIHVATLVERFRARRDAMLSALERELGGSEASWTTPQGGLFIWLRLSDDVDATELLMRGLNGGVAFVPGSVFSQDPRHDSVIRLCFASATEDVIPEGVARIAAAIGNR